MFRMSGNMTYNQNILNNVFLYFVANKNLCFLNYDFDDKIQASNRYTMEKLSGNGWDMRFKI